MFKNREIRLKVEKTNKDQTPETDCCPSNFERKAEFVLRKLDKIGTKMFMGVCIYVVFDTYRQVSIARANYNPQG